jgi:hypothetical protein
MLNGVQNRLNLQLHRWSLVGWLVFNFNHKLNRSKWISDAFFLSPSTTPRRFELKRATGRAVEPLARARLRSNNSTRLTSCLFTHKLCYRPANRKLGCLTPQRSSVAKPSSTKLAVIAHLTALPLVEALVRSGHRRLRPVLMTSLAAALGMLPLAWGIGSGAEMLRPLAVAVIGALCISVLLSLIATPVVYYILRTLKQNPLPSSEST